MNHDETLFGGALYDPAGYAGEADLFGRRVPIMLMSYVGTLKALVYKGVYAVWPPSAASTRVPAIIAGALAIWFFYLLLDRSAGRAAGLIGAALLATDSAYLFTVRLDWGPVALQHLLLMLGLWSVQRGSIPFGCFCFGLAMWDKAIFAWLLAGLCIATVAVFPKHVWRAVTVRNVVLATAAFMLGAAPLIAYNVDSNWETFRSNTAMDTAELGEKARIFWLTLISQGPVARIAREAPETVRPHYLHVALIISLVGGLIWQRTRRLTAFAAIFLVVSWLMMALTRGAGGSLHHIALLWPLPHMIIAGVFGALYSGRLRWVIGAATLALVITNSLTLADNFRVFLRNGGTNGWTEAIYPAYSFLDERQFREVHVTDWGFLNVIRLLSRGRMPVVVSNDAKAENEYTEEERTQMMPAIKAADTVFIGHVYGEHFWEGKTRWLERIARESGYRKQILGTFRDRQGRPMIEAYRFVP